MCYLLKRLLRHFRGAFQKIFPVKKEISNMEWTAYYFVFELDIDSRRGSTIQSNYPQFLPLSINCSACCLLVLRSVT